MTNGPGETSPSAFHFHSIGSDQITSNGLLSMVSFDSSIENKVNSNKIFIDYWNSRDACCQTFTEINTRFGIFSQIKGLWYILVVCLSIIMNMILIVDLYRLKQSMKKMTTAIDRTVNFHHSYPVTYMILAIFQHFAVLNLLYSAFIETVLIYWAFTFWWEFSENFCVIFQYLHKLSWTINSITVCVMQVIKVFFAQQQRKEKEREMKLRNVIGKDPNLCNFEQMEHVFHDDGQQSNSEENNHNKINIDQKLIYMLLLIWPISLTITIPVIYSLEITYILPEEMLFFYRLHKLSIPKAIEQVMFSNLIIYSHFQCALPIQCGKKRVYDASRNYRLYLILINFGPAFLGTLYASCFGWADYYLAGGKKIKKFEEAEKQVLSQSRRNEEEILCKEARSDSKISTINSLKKFRDTTVTTGNEEPSDGWRQASARSARSFKSDNTDSSTKALLSNSTGNEKIRLKWQSSLKARNRSGLKVPENLANKGLSTSFTGPRRLSKMISKPNSPRSFRRINTSTYKLKSINFFQRTLDKNRAKMKASERARLEAIEQDRVRREEKARKQKILQQKRKEQKEKARILGKKEKEMLIFTIDKITKYYFILTLPSQIHVIIMWVIPPKFIHHHISNIIFSVLEAYLNLFQILIPWLWIRHVATPMINLIKEEKNKIKKMSKNRRFCEKTLGAIYPINKRNLTECDLEVHPSKGLGIKNTVLPYGTVASAGFSLKMKKGCENKDESCSDSDGSTNSLYGRKDIFDHQFQ